MRLTRTAVLTLAASALVLGGCGTMRNSIGLTKVTPDEFLTVSTAPLTVPPEYGLRPPAPGQPRPQELAPESAARQILLGQRQAVTRSPGEQVLVAEAGGDRADPQTANGAVTIDAASESERLQALTGAQAGIIIAPRRDTGFKLPGL